MSAATTINITKYARLLESVAPVPIESKADYERMLAAAEKLMDIPEAKMSREQGRLLSLLSILIEVYEAEHYPIPKAAPADMLAFLLKEKELKPIAVAEILGTRGKVSEILSGKRAISKAQAKRLGAFFGLSADVFI